MEKKFYTYLVLILISLLISKCDIFDSDEDFVRLVPDNTIFIASALEATTDTVHHYPEVYVGSVVHKKGKYAVDIGPVIIPGIWWPMLNAQVNFATSSWDLVRTDINDADVTVTGPLGSEREKTVVFKNEGLGVYGDIEHELELIHKERYRLDVVFTDQRHYRAETILPGLIEWDVPGNSLKVELTLSKSGEAVYREEAADNESLRFAYQIPEYAWMTTTQVNYSDDDPDKLAQSSAEDGFSGFLYGDRGPFLRQGPRYSIVTNSNPNAPAVRTLGPNWSKSSLDPLLDSRTAWMRVSQMNEDLSRRWFYQNVFIFFGSISGDHNSIQAEQRALARRNEDTEYMFRISNIQKLGENGEPVSREELDAIGVFGGFSSAYRKVTIYPVRSWDPDTLNWAK